MIWAVTAVGLVLGVLISRLSTYRGRASLIMARIRLARTAITVLAPAIRWLYLHRVTEPLYAAGELPAGDDQPDPGSQS